MNPHLTVLITTCVILSACVPTARADFLGAVMARHAMSPNGQRVVRIERAENIPEAKDALHFHAVVYEFDESQDAFVRRAAHPLTNSLSHLMHLADSGELVLISLDETAAVRLYSNAGKLVQSWNLNQFLTPREINACAATGSTVQWFEEGRFTADSFHFRGPSRVIRSLPSPYTVMRGPNHKISFSASLDLKTGRLTKN